MSLRARRAFNTTLETAIKIILLITLIGAIVAASCLSGEHKSPEVAA